jgi:hypothetical protein
MTSVRRAKLGNDAVNRKVNFADGILQAMSMLHTDDFVQCVVSDKAASPTVMLYLSRQVELIKQLCFGGTQGSVLCFDTTFNLTKGLYVTVSAFKNPCLVRKKTGEEPIFIGPVCWHGSLSADNYATFFYHLARLFRTCDANNLVVGSDNSSALRGALRHAFPYSPQLVCTRHLKTDAERYLVKEVPNDKRRRDVIRAVFGASGLSSVSDIALFDGKVKVAFFPTNQLVFKCAHCVGGFI